MVLIAGSMVLGKFFGVFGKLFGAKDGARPETPADDPVRARLQKLRKIRGGPDCPDLVEQVPVAKSLLGRPLLDSVSSGGFPRYEDKLLPQFVSRKSREVDAFKEGNGDALTKPDQPLEKKVFFTGSEIEATAPRDNEKESNRQFSPDNIENAVQPKIPSFSQPVSTPVQSVSTTAPGPMPAPPGFFSISSPDFLPAKPTETAPAPVSLAGGQSGSAAPAPVDSTQPRPAVPAAQGPAPTISPITDRAQATANAHKRRLFDTKTLLAMRIKQELARSQEIARIKELAHVDQRLGKRFEPRRTKIQAQTMKLEALERNNLLSDEDRAKLLQQSKAENKPEKARQLFGLDTNPIRTSNPADLVFIEPLTVSPIETAAAPIETDNSADGKILAQEWDIQPELTLTAMQQSMDAQSSLRGLESQGVEDLFSDFDTTANLPNRSSPFEKFSEASLKVLAGNPRTPARILSWLASHLNPEIRALVARNRSSLPETIWLLAKDYDESVRLAIAEYLETDRGILKMLSNDTSPLVAWRAKNSLYLLKAGARTGSNLAQMPAGLQTTDASKRSPNPFKNLVPAKTEPEVNEEEINFLKVIAQKTSTPARRLADLAKHANKEIRALVAENANAPLETLWYLSKDTAAEVKLKLTENYNCPIEIIEALQDDKDSFVSWQARNILIKLMGQPTAPISLTEKQMRAPLLHSQ